MAVHRDSEQSSIERLGPQDLIEVFSFLDRDPILNVYLVALTLRDGLSRPRDEYWGMRVDSGLDGLVHLGAQSGAVLPVAASPEAFEVLAEQTRDRIGTLPRRFQVIGARAGVATFVQTLGVAGLMPRIHRPQLYMAVERGQLRQAEPLAELRPARPGDYPAVYQSGAELRAEELDEDPRRVDAAGYARRVEEECRDGYTWVWADEGSLRFRASVSALTGDAAQVSGVYTTPVHRNRGVARRALGELCSRLLEKSASVCLFVNDFNAPAIAVYRRLGFRAVAEWASAFYGPAVKPR